MFATKFVKVAWHQHFVDINVNFTRKQTVTCKILRKFLVTTLNSDIYESFLHQFPTDTVRQSAVQFVMLTNSRISDLKRSDGSCVVKRHTAQSVRGSAASAVFWLSAEQLTGPVLIISKCKIVQLNQSLIICMRSFFYTLSRQKEAERLKEVERMNELLQRAVDHHTKSLMKFGGWLPWQKLIQNRRQQEQTACAAFRKCFLRSANSYPFIVHTVTFCRFVQNTVHGAVKFDNWKNLETVNLRQGG